MIGTVCNVDGTLVGIGMGGNVDGTGINATLGGLVGRGMGGNIERGGVLSDDGTTFVRG